MVITFYLFRESTVYRFSCQHDACVETEKLEMPLLYVAPSLHFDETDRVFFSILKLLIQLIACSTWIQRLATSLVFLTSAEVI